MKTRKVWMVTPVSAALCAVMVCFLIPMFFLNRTLFYIQAVLSLCMIGITIWHAVTLHRSIRRYLGSLISNLNPEDRMALENMPIPVTAVTAEGELLWYNTLFRREVLGGEDVYGSKLETVFNGLTAERLNRRLFPQVRSKGNTYVIYAAKLRKGGQGAYVLYCIDNTELTRIAKEYEDSRPVVLSLYIDNSEEITQNLRDSERAQLISRVETLLEDWIGACAGIFRKCGSDRFLALVEHRHLAGMLESRFDILDKVRSVRTAEGVSVTLSIGVGIGKSFNEAETLARQSLDMALGRGGDQAAIKTQNGFDFYGGLSKSVEKRTKVRTRVVASALQDMILTCDNVLLMGHKYSDLDCLGSCSALAMACRSLGKPAYAVYDPQTTLAGALAQHYAKHKKDDVFIGEKEALSQITDNTLLIITDIHQPERLDVPELYRRAKAVVVIDHHRKTVTHIDNASLFYHEPNASSASEMVAELVQYMPDAKIGRIEAEGLFAGMMLDTRNFVMKAGVRTFEAAAYLRRVGADTVAVKQLFSETMDTYRQKAEIVAAAEHYEVTAIAFADNGQGAQLRIAAAQAADELLCVKGIEASFVLFPDGDGYSISARSYGAVNVQLVMEALGGGGHQTMAGALLRSTDRKTAESMLKRAIDVTLTERRRAQAVQEQAGQ